MSIMRSTRLPKGIPPSPYLSASAGDAEPALNVAMVYQDPLTRYWAAEFWDRVGELISHHSVGRQSWRIEELKDPRVFAEAGQAAAEADVLVISVRDAGEWPASLHVWIQSWLPRRAGRVGALVALIGVPGRPDGQSGRAHQYLARVAHEAGLDFLPRERKLPDVAPVSSGLVKVGGGLNSSVASRRRPSSLGGPNKALWRLHD